MIRWCRSGQPSMRFRWRTGIRPALIAPWASRTGRSARGACPPALPARGQRRPIPLGQFRMPSPTTHSGSTGCDISPMCFPQIHIQWLPAAVRCSSPALAYYLVAYYYVGYIALGNCRVVAVHRDFGLFTQPARARTGGGSAPRPAEPAHRQPASGAN